MATSIKISQLPAKGSALEATDLLEVSEFNGTGYVTKSITGAEIIASVPPTSVEWGDIGGTLSSQTDLQTALNAKVTGNTAITGATKTKVTYDSKGLVTAGADATTADIADSTNKRYVTDANLTVIGNTSGTNTGDQTLSGLGGVPTTRTLTINGTTQDLSADRTFTISTGITIGTTAITSGTVGRVLFEGTGNVVQESANLFWDNTNGRLGIGTSSPAYPLEIVKNQNASTSINISNTTSGTSSASVLNLTTDSGAGSCNYSKASSTTNSYKILSAKDAGFYNVGGGDFAFMNDTVTGKFKWAMGASSTAQMTLFSTGNFAINTTTDAGFKLDVNGTARVQGGLTISGPNGVNYLTIGTGVGNAFFTWSSYFLNVTGVRFRSETIVGDPSGTAGAARASSAIDSRGYLVTDSIGIGTTTNTINASAIAQIDSTTKGFLCPRMTTTQKNAIATPATGLMVYDTTLNLISVYNGTIWISL